MNAIDLLATSLNKRDDKPNQDLAGEIIRSGRNDWVKELVENLNNKDKNIQSDCIKVLYEIGERGSAEMIAPYCHEIGSLLTSKNNRLVWGAMTALDMIVSVNPDEVCDLLPSIMTAVDKGSVITIDHGVGILAKLSGMKKYAGTAFPLLIEQLKKCPAKQLPMYAEKSTIVNNASDKKQLVDLILTRMSEMEKESQRKRLNKVIAQMNK